MSNENNNTQQKKTRKDYIIELDLFSTTMRTYYHVLGLKNLINDPSSERMCQLTEYELATMFDIILSHVLRIGECIDGDNVNSDFLDMVYQDKAFPDFPGAVLAVEDYEQGKEEINIELLKKSAQILTLAAQQLAAKP